MHSVSHHRAYCHADFLTLPLGEWSRRTDLERLTPGGRHIQAKTGISAAMANTYAEIHGLGRRSSR
jgi:hypothetical protein